MKTTESDALVKKFASASQEHYHAILVGDYAVANAHAATISRVIEEIRTNENATIGALLPLLDDSRPEVSLMAAVYLLKHDTEKSLETLALLKVRDDLIGFRADQAMKRWNDGEW